jgi:hypothetical protein
VMVRHLVRFMLVPCLFYSSSLKIGTCSFETSIDFPLNTQCYVPEDFLKQYEPVCLCNGDALSSLWDKNTVFNIIMTNFRLRMLQITVWCTIWQSHMEYSTTPCPESASELYRSSDRRLSAKVVPTFADIRTSRSQRGGSPTTVI